MQSYRWADDACDLHKMVDVHTLIIMYLIFMFNYHIHCTCSVVMAHTAFFHAIGQKNEKEKEKEKRKKGRERGKQSILRAPNTHC